MDSELLNLEETYFSIISSYSYVKMILNLHRTSKFYDWTDFITPNPIFFSSYFDKQSTFSCVERGFTVCTWNKVKFTFVTVTYV